jgi:hypothetical protein
MDGVEPIEPTEWTRRRVKHLQIAYAKAQEKRVAA